MACIVRKRKVCKFKIIDCGLAPVFNDKGRAGQRRTLQLRLHLLDGVEIDMGIPNGVNELAGDESRYLRNQV